MNGKVVEEQFLKNLKPGKNTFEKQIKEISEGGIYILTIETNYEKAIRKIILAD